MLSFTVWSHNGEGPEDKSLSLQENNRSKVNPSYMIIIIYLLLFI